jgi:hypothetical protein
VKLIRSTNDKFLFALSETEGELLQLLLRLYPRIPPGYHRISKTLQPTETEEAQRLLDEALEENRRKNIQQVADLLTEKRLLTHTKTGFRLTLSHEQFEWLLQVLNDVRVGSWIALGAPDTENGEEIKITNQTAPHVWAMETAGYFEMTLLEAVENPASQPENTTGPDQPG